MLNIGTIGEISRQFSSIYYRAANEVTEEKLEDHYFVETVMCRLDFTEVERLQI